MRQKILFLLGFWVICISCQKGVDVLPEKKFDYSRFFPESESNKPGIKRVFDYLKSKKEFLPDFVAVAGYPRWDKAIFKNDNTCIIPLVSENNTAVTGVLVAEVLNDQVICRYSLLIHYGKMGEFKKDFVFSMMQLENFVFGRTSFKIYDHSLLGAAKIIFLRKGQRSQAQIASTNDDPCELVEIWHDPTEEECHCSGDEFFTGRYMYDGACFDSPDYYVIPRGDGTSMTLPGEPPGGLGGTGGSNPPPYASTFTEKLNWLLNQLDMTPESNEFLPTSEATVNEIYHYLYSNSSDERKEIAHDHIQRMAIDADYLSFVTGYRSSSGYSITPWWNNQTWLDDSNHFNLDITPPENGLFDKLNAAERVLVGQYPLQAYIISKNVDVAFTTAVASGLPGDLNGKQDAFRHAFFQAINTRDVPPRLWSGFNGTTLSSSQIVSMFAIAHESEVPLVLQLEKQMDIFNNNVGIAYCWNCWNTSNSTIETAIMNKLNNGELRYINPLDPIASDKYDRNGNGIQDCPTCLNGIIPSSVLTPTNR